MEHRFIADAMLGRLARWMRLLGFDVLYYPDIEDARLVALSREQGRSIITRDTLLLKRKGLNNPIFIASDNVFDQLCEVLERPDCNPAGLAGRCSICNGELTAVLIKASVQDRVPEHVYRSFDNFTQCADCLKIYWEGSHYKKIREKLGTALDAGGNN